MNFRHEDDTLRRIDEEEGYNGGYDAKLVRAFRLAMDIIREADNETDLLAFKSLRYQKLKGKRRHLRSIRLNDQFRLRLAIEQHKAGNVLVIVAMGDFHDL